jgi:putative tryptophan/tyrosine transport system substrate-binding protein
VTGTTIYAPHLIAERLRIMKQIVADLDKVSMLTNGNNPNNQAQFVLLNAECHALAIEVQQLDVRKPTDVEPELANARSYGAKGLFNAVDSFINSQRSAIAKLAAHYKLPMIYSDREYVLAGGLMSLGPGHQEGYYDAAKYVDLILRGADPAELAVAPTKSTEFSISRGALERIGLTLPKNVIERVDEWLE